MTATDGRTALGHPSVQELAESLRGQVLRANGGLYYRRYEEFAAAMDLLVSAPGLADRLGSQGREYFQANYSWAGIMEKYERLLARAAGPR